MKRFSQDIANVILARREDGRLQMAFTCLAVPLAIWLFSSPLSFVLSYVFCHLGGFESPAAFLPRYVDDARLPEVLSYMRLFAGVIFLATSAAILVLVALYWFFATRLAGVYLVKPVIVRNAEPFDQAMMNRLGLDTPSAQMDFINQWKIPVFVSEDDLGPQEGAGVKARRYPFTQVPEIGKRYLARMKREHRLCVRSTDIEAALAKSQRSALAIAAGQAQALKRQNDSLQEECYLLEGRMESERNIRQDEHGAEIANLKKRQQEETDALKAQLDETAKRLDATALTLSQLKGRTLKAQFKGFLCSIAAGPIFLRILEVRPEQNMVTRARLNEIFDEAIQRHAAVTKILRQLGKELDFGALAEDGKPAARGLEANGNEKPGPTYHVADMVWDYLVGEKLAPQKGGQPSANPDDLRLALEQPSPETPTK